MSQTLSTSIFYLSSAMSLYTDPGPLAFPQVPHKKPKNSTQLYLPASVLMAIQQKSYPSQRNRLSPLPPLFFSISVPIPPPATARPDVVDLIESSQQPTVVDKHLSVLSPFSAALLPNMPDIRHLVRHTRSECRYRNNNHIFCE